MKEKFAEFWVCAEPEEITRLLRLEPTSTRINQPYSYWELICSNEKYGNDCFYSLLKILKTRESEIKEATSKFAVGVNRVGEMEEDEPNGENHFNFSIEVEEMALLSRLGIPLCVSVFKHK